VYWGISRPTAIIWLKLIPPLRHQEAPNPGLSLKNPSTPIGSGTIAFEAATHAILNCLAKLINLY
jgi:hypothetical protein